MANCTWLVVGSFAVKWLVACCNTSKWTTAGNIGLRWTYIWLRFSLVSRPYVILWLVLRWQPCSLPADLQLYHHLTTYRVNTTVCIVIGSLPSCFKGRAVEGVCLGGSCRQRARVCMAMCLYWLHWMSSWTRSLWCAVVTAVKWETCILLLPLLLLLRLAKSVRGWEQLHAMQKSLFNGDRSWPWPDALNPVKDYLFR